MADPTIVLVHGAFADASSWRRLYEKLAGDGLMIKAPPNPLRGIGGGDAEYIQSVIAQIDGPAVLVGHSYGGAVITGRASPTTSSASSTPPASLPIEGRTSEGSSRTSPPRSPARTSRPRRFPTAAPSSPSTRAAFMRCSPPISPRPKRHSWRSRNDRSPACRSASRRRLRPGAPSRRGRPAHRRRRDPSRTGQTRTWRDGLSCGQSCSDSSEREPGSAA
jgi:pimeloyl-ACP methyl ester carboxylesterase